MTQTVIVAGARTPLGRFQGAFSSLSAQDLGGVAIAGALDRAGARADTVDAVVMGQVLQAGQGQITARQAAVKAGLGMGVPCLTVNKVCLSGLNAIALADQLIRASEVETVVAGGMESMTGAPYALPAARAGARMGDTQLVDLMVHDGLWCAFDGVHMGESTDAASASLGVSFPAPVPVDSRVRLGVELAAVDPLLEGAAQATLTATFELEGSPKPCCVAEVLFRYYP